MRQTTSGTQLLLGRIFCVEIVICRTDSASTLDGGFAHGSFGYPYKYAHRVISSRLIRGLRTVQSGLNGTVGIADKCHYVARGTDGAINKDPGSGRHCNVTTS